jgi:hypothetical protein
MTVDVRVLLGKALDGGYEMTRPLEDAIAEMLPLVG